MAFDEVLEQVRELLQSKGRVAYRALKRRFEVDEEYLEDLKAELIDAEHVAHDEDGKVLVWRGGTTVVRASPPLAPQTGDSASRTLHSLSPQPLDAQREAERRQKSKRAFSRQSRLLDTNKQSRWGCGQQ
ncbi:MAG TPA: hypothetical protein VKK81_24745 [Candidatus Binatia bacterium]|nr:hypothetical protein [Candidatus Binatia bacterium]